MIRVNRVRGIKWQVYIGFIGSRRARVGGKGSGGGGATMVVSGEGP